MLSFLLRKYFPIVFALILILQASMVLPVFAQKDDYGSIDVANKYFENMEYYMAAQEYEKVLKNNPSHKVALFRLAESYRLYFEYEKAELNYKRLLVIGEKEYPLARFWVGILQKTNGKYEEAIESFEKFLQTYKGTGKDAVHYIERAKIEMEGCHVAITEMKKPQRDYEFENLPSPVNTENSEY
ncbi:MAG TPA: tetratricopeptide repeat protein, partial [Cytophagaceae bacterium]